MKIGHLSFFIVALRLVFSATIPALAQGAVDVKETVTIGGIPQWVAAKGVDSSKPLLLYLHGGPGSSTMVYADRFMSRLYSQFIVAQWDQRGSGKTASLSKHDTTFTVAAFQQDTYEVIQYLLKRFAKNRLYLVSESWGNVLGMLTVRDHPELLHAYVAISPMIDQNHAEQLSLELMLKKARETNHQQAQEELTKVSIPFRTGHELYVHRKWLAYFTQGTNGRKKAYPERIYTEWAKTWLPVFREASQLNFSSVLSQTSVPIYFFIGRNDQQVSAQLVEGYYQSLKADQKQLIWFEKSAHNITFAEPEKLQAVILEKVLEQK